MEIFMLQTVTRTITDWWHRRTTIDKLEGLDDRLLADMGIPRDHISRFVDGRQTRDQDC